MKNLPKMVVKLGPDDSRGLKLGTDEVCEELKSLPSLGIFLSRSIPECPLCVSKVKKFSIIFGIL